MADMMTFATAVIVKLPELILASSVPHPQSVRVGWCV